jgi:hypothetical protein
MEATMSTPNYRGDLSAGMNRANNVDFQLDTMNFLFNREPQYNVYLYNVSESSFEVSRPPLLRKLVIAGRPKDASKRYNLVTTLPQPLLVPKGNVDSNEIDIIPQDTRRFAMDIINPDNLGLDQDAVLDPKMVFSQGSNLGAKGVFWSLNGPGSSKYGHKEEPTDDEINRAISRMEKEYKRLLEAARSVEVSNPGSLSQFLGPEHHAAADYFGEEYTWHGKKTRTDFCPNCGDRIKAGAAFHKTDEGGLCIIDWQKAVKAGVRTREQAFDATGDETFAPRTPSAPVAPQAPIRTVPTESK